MSKLRIEFPWVIVHAPNGPGGKLETILGGQAQSSYGHFGIVIADVVRHVAKHFKVDPADVMEVVNVELGNPTSDITTVKSRNEH